MRSRVWMASCAVLALILGVVANGAPTASAPPGIGKATPAVKVDGGAPRVYAGDTYFGPGARPVCEAATDGGMGADCTNQPCATACDCTRYAACATVVQADVAWRSGDDLCAGPSAKGSTLASCIKGRCVVVPCH